MTQQLEAMKLALEALESCYSSETSMYMSFDKRKTDSAMTALRQAIEQAQKQEPVVTLDELEQEIYENTRRFVPRDVMEWMLKRYYTSPPQRQPLTDEQIEDITADIHGLPIHVDDYEFARAIEAAHGIKENT